MEEGSHLINKGHTIISWTRLSLQVQCTDMKIKGTGEEREIGDDWSWKKEEYQESRLCVRNDHLIFTVPLTVAAPKGSANSVGPGWAKYPERDRRVRRGCGAPRPPPDSDHHVPSTTVRYTQA